MTLNLIPFRAEHLEWIEGREEKEDTSVYEGVGTGFSLISNVRCIACAGILDAAPGVASCWMVRGDDLPKYSKTVIKTTKAFFAMMKPYYHRFQMLVDTRNETAITFAEHFGFEKEAKLRKYDGTNDYWMMSWLS